MTLPFDLAPRQVEDIVYLSQYERVGLFWDVGVGKTVASTVLAEMYDRDVNLAVVRPILIEQWYEWLAQTYPNQVDKIKVYYGGERDWRELKDAKWIITSHGIFRRDYSHLVKALIGRSHTTILDEAQDAKSVQSKLYKLTKLVSQGQPLILATATPTTFPIDAYSYISLKTPDAYRGVTHFENLHVAERDFYKRVIEWKNLDVVTEHLMRQATKRTKDEVFGDLIKQPCYIPIHYNLAPAHKKLYDKLVDECLLSIENGSMKIDASTPQRLYHLTQQMVLNWGYFSDRPDDRAAGLDLLDQVVDETDCFNPNRSKLMVWTYYQMSSASLHEYLRKKFSGAVVAAYGKVDSQKAVQKFLHDPATRILVAQPASVGVGLNAMEVCWEQLFLEFSTIPMHIWQAIGRVDRMGQKHVPNIRWGVARQTVQDRLLANLLRNDDTVNKVELNTKSLRAALMGG